MMRASILIAAALLAAGCLQSRLAACGGDVVCPPGDVCAPGGTTCVAAEQVTACTGRVEDDPCIYLGFAGVCRTGVCEVARPDPFTLTTSLPGPGAGRVVSEPPGIDCGATCSASFVMGTRVTLTATPLSGSSFGGWSGPCAGTGACEVTVTAAVAVGAIFVLPPPPTVTEIDPPSGAGIGSRVAIVGTNLAWTSSVTFAGVAQPSFSVVSPTRIETTVPPGARSGPVTIITPGGVAISAPYGLSLADVVSVGGLEGSVGGCIDIEVIVAQDHSLQANIRVEVDTGTGSFRPATPVASAPVLLGVATSPAGVAYTFHWDSTRDDPHLTGPVDVRVSATVANVAGSSGHIVTRTVALANGVVFERGIDVHLGDSSWWTVGDLDRDGHVDVVVGSSASGASVLFGDGQGGFGAPVTLALDLPFTRGTLVDLDRDGALDLLLLAGNGTVWASLGQGDGSFAAPVLVPGIDTSWIDVVDADRDGRRDIVYYATAFVTARGRGDGTFDVPDLESPYPYVPEVVTGDANGDGRIDIVNYGPDGIVTALGDGAGGFGATVSSPGSAPGLRAPAALADLDGDGKLDLVLSADDGGAIASGDGTGAFASPRHFFDGQGLGKIAIGDIDLDGKPDVVMATAAQRAGVFFVHPDGSDVTALFVEDGTVPEDVAIADLDGDGRPDVLVRTTDGVLVLHNVTPRSCQRSFVAATPVPVGSARDQVAAGDLDGDGRLDVVAAGGDLGPPSVAILLGAGDGTFRSTTTVPATALPVEHASVWSRGLAVVDLDRDGKLDIVTAGGGSSSDSSTEESEATLYGRGDGGFATPIDVVTGDLVGIAAGDFNGDGRRDLVTNLDERTVLAVGQGNRTMSPFTTVSEVHEAVAVTSDVDGDGKDDLILGGSFGEIFVFRGGSAFPQAPGVVELPALDTVTLAVADVTGDGHPDIVLGNGYLHTIAVARGKGDGTFGPAVQYPLFDEQTDVGVPVTGLVVADFDRDGRPDVAAAARGNVYVLYGSASGFAPPVVYPITSDPYPAPGLGLAAGDLDGDGRPDLLVAHAGGDEIIVLLSR